MIFKKGVIHLGIIVLALIGLAGLTTVATFARNQSAGRQYSIRLDQPQGPCFPIADVNNDNKVDDNDRILMLRYNASSWSKRAHIPYEIPTPTGATAQSTDLRDGHLFYLVPSRGDLNADGQVNSADSRMLKDFLNRKIETFPRCSQPMAAALPPAPAWSNQGQLNLTSSNVEADSATFTWTGQISTGGTLLLILWEDNCEHPRNPTEYYRVTSKIFNYGRSPRIYWDSPNNGYTFRNLSPGATYCAYFTAGLNGNRGLEAYSNDVTISTGLSTGSAAGSVETTQVSPCGTFGDVNFDNKVDTLDIQITNRMISVGPPPVLSQDWKNADLNADGRVDNRDLNLLTRYINRQITRQDIPACQALTPVNHANSKRPPCQSLGDANEDTYVDEADAVAVLNNLRATPELLSPQGGINADVNNDHIISAIDASLIRQYVDGIIPDFPACRTSEIGEAVSQPPSCLGDFNGDRKVTAADVTILTGKYRSTDPAYDLNGDGIVNISDITKEVSMVGTTCP